MLDITLEMLDYIEAVKGIEAGLKAVREGRTSPARETLTKIKRKYEISNDASAEKLS
jgi:hypothetical protein